ncbi:DUF779 domain-containing protein [Nakamurella flava]|uniref:DUF779 domain-containing protein n=1 Tax=Nakamurella flava TaxID=2576308 RepID=A0A4U6QCY7_9ACTN|nr:DUF779 domain-containing protein [Nakamurella flava]TKV57789.1 DUF779 domain-containing protein [Nakamurella flava]
MTEYATPSTDLETPAPDVVDPHRVDVTPAAAELLRSLIDRNGPLMFHQSGGCCDGSSPMCYPQGDFITGAVDVRLGDLDVNDPGAADAPPIPTIPVWMSESQFAYWKHTHLTIDVVKGRGSGFSLEAPYGVRFMIRSRLLTDAEVEHFERVGYSTGE